MNTTADIRWPNWFVGFEEMFRPEFSKIRNTNGVPYNVVKRDKDKEVWQVEVAAAGYSQDNLNVEVEGDTLSISGQSDEEAEGSEYHYRGISGRSFEYLFKLAPSATIKDVTFKDGLLVVNIIPSKETTKQVLAINAK